MEKTIQLKNLIEEVSRDIESIANAKTYHDIDAIERRCVQGIQMIQIAAGQVSYDLVNTSDKRRRELRTAKVVAPTIKENLTVEEEKPKKEAKKTRKTTKRKTTKKAK